MLFFKQKTAYEMRISDWSSDVCSSDLPSRKAASRRVMSPAAAVACRIVCSCDSGSAERPAARLVIIESAVTLRPSRRATITSGTVDMQTAYPPRSRAARNHAGVPGATHVGEGRRVARRIELDGRGVV